ECISVPDALKAGDTLAQEGIEPRVIDLYSIKPLDEETLRSLTCPIVTAEDHWPEGGLGEAALSALGDADARPPGVRLAVHEMPPSGKPAELLAEAGIDADGIAAAARKLVRDQVSASERGCWSSRDERYVSARSARGSTTPAVGASPTWCPCRSSARTAAP